MSNTKPTDEELDGLAAEYALGALDEAERIAFEERLSADPEARQAVAKWESMLGFFSDAPAVTPGDAIWQQIEATLDSDEKQDGAYSTIRKDEGEWEMVAPGLEKQVLYIDRTAKTISYYLRVGPGVTIPPHEHARVEECLMMAGEMWVGDLRLVAGDYHIAHAGSRHVDVRSETGATFYVRAALPEAT